MILHVKSNLSKICSGLFVITKKVVYEDSIENNTYIKYNSLDGKTKNYLQETVHQIIKNIKDENVVNEGIETIVWLLTDNNLFQTNSKLDILLLMNTDEVNLILDHYGEDSRMVARLRKYFNIPWKETHGTCV